MSELDVVDEFLTHHGVKGMHWGHRKGSSEGGSEGGSGKGGSEPKVKKPKPTAQDILQARARQAVREDKQYDLSKEALTATSEKGRQRALAEIARIDKEGAADQEIAKRMTRGEKIGTTILLAGLAGTVLASGASNRAARR